jgi:N-acetylglucosaminyldiphosphoundecaprenol N-acetyl-beta-D-mannosaminyltransferase
MSRPGRVGVIGSQISACDSEAALDYVHSMLREGAGGYVCFTNVHGAVTGRRDARFLDITNQSLLSLADGKPVYWVGRLHGASALGHVPGPDFMLATLRRFPERRHYFYGSTPQVLQALQVALRRLVPGLMVCGSCSPPFRSQDEAERRHDLQSIRESGAEFVWIGLGAPKQERWMASNWRSLCPAILLGVGAAFDFHAGNVRRAPGALRFMGLEWLHRLVHEPRRMWRRYLTTNSLFVLYLLRDAVTRSRKA